MISAVILTRNEEKKIKQCIESVYFCDEIILIDDCSTDNTVKIAKKLGAKVYIKHLKENFSSQRNYGLKIAKNEWVFFIDADEVVTDKLKSEILNSIKNKSYNGFYIKRKDFIYKKQINFGDLKNAKFLRLGKKNTGNWTGMVHEVWRLEGQIGELKNYILHYPHKSLIEFLRSIDFYSSIRAKELYLNKKSSNLIEIVIYPLAKFIKLFILKLGILDAEIGFIHATFMSFYSYLVRSKLYLLKKNEIK